MKYAWSDGMRTAGTDPNEVGKELAKLRKEYGGSITAEVVVDAASSKKSPLHPLFEWDDTEAARQYRLEQARSVIRHIIVVDDGEKAPRRAFVQVNFQDSRAYVDTVDALKDDDLRIQVLGRAYAEMQSFERRYNELTELSDVLDAIKKTGGKVKKVLAKARR